MDIGGNMVNDQDFLNALYKDIQMVRGDTLAFNFQIQGLEGAEPQFLFTVKDELSDNAIFYCNNDDGFAEEDYIYTDEVDLATYSCVVTPNKTESLDTGRYYYDLKMYLGTNVITLMRGRLELLYSVAHI